jgi:FkbM family methyltransferase
LKPEYVYQPARFLHRLLHKPDRTSPTALTAFGFPLDLMPDELISNSIRRKGMYDIVTAEAVYRLLDVNEQAIDAGAHVGLMSVIMALRVWPKGMVQSFEPHPDVYKILSGNAVRFNEGMKAGIIRTSNLALSETARQAPLFLPQDWNANTGVARLDAPSKSGPPAATVECQTLDEAVALEKPVLLKLDVEGHELAALRGAPRTLEKLRDIVFEDFGTYRTSAMTLLERQGFRIFALYRTLSRPILSEADRRGIPEKADPNYLATRDPDRAQQRFKDVGWMVLRPLFRPTEPLS